MNIFTRIRNKLFPKTGLYKYNDYEEYKSVQIQTNLDKINNSWVNKDNIMMLSDYLKSNIPHLHFGICHGTRRGDEQAWFREALGCDVIGTEISPNRQSISEHYPMGFQSSERGIDRKQGQRHVLFHHQA